MGRSRNDKECTTLVASNSPSLIKSPNYPSDYPKNLDKCWIIAPANPDKHVSIAVLEMKLEEPCGSDWVSLKKGQTSSGVELAQLCGPNSDLVVFRSQSGFYVQFHSDESFESMGFMLEYISVEGSCETLVATETVQTFNSPNYPGKYDNHANLCWNIVSLDPTMSVDLTVVDFDVENHSYCNYDYVEILDGQGNSAPILDTLCGDNVTATFKGMQGLQVEFVSDEQGTAKGFKMEYKAIPRSCEKLTATPNPATIQSPNYPYAYPKGSYVCWEITADPSLTVKLVVNGMDIESSEGCSYDYLKITALNSDATIRVLCGSQVEGPFLYADGVLIEFASDMYQERTGFEINYFATN